ncbi:hypothetical protein PENSTE_c040G04589 [Penicillium steckii]|uniref:Uncharacterized protein n=1 Tax=Penicillium steckii TaxID=303698 RepID=A0A1V6SJN7_9EURO|nr:hypothetical protein PENSTE_c040G04589 [Penicillium steckii]
MLVRDDTARIISTTHLNLRSLNNGNTPRRMRTSAARTPLDLSQVPLLLAYLKLDSSEQVDLGQISQVHSAEWEERRSYQENAPTCIHYRLEWRVTINNREVSQHTEEGRPYFGPSSFCQLSSEQKPEKFLRRKTARHRRVTADDTVITVLTSDRTKRRLKNDLTIPTLSGPLSRNSL